MRLIRFRENDIGTWGKLTWDDIECYTFEPAGPDCTECGKDRRVPQGKYKLRWHNSPTYKKKMPNLFNDKVSASRCILIHNGNFPDDTAGCVLLGRVLDNKGVLDSKSIFNIFREKLISKFPLDKEFMDIELEIINDFIE